MHKPSLFKRFSFLIPVLFGVILAVLPMLGVLSGILQQQVALAAVYALVVVGFNVSYGFGGQLALGQVAVFAGGAYTAAMLNHAGVNELGVAIPLSLLVAIILGFISGVPGLRLNEWSLALTAFFLVYMIPSVTGIFGQATGGAQGLAGILNPEFFGIKLGRNQLFLAIILVTTAILLVYRNVVKSRYGSALRVLKQGPQLTQSVGVSPMTLRMSSYVLGALPAGVAGVFFAYLSAYVYPGTFSFALVTVIIAASVVGGTRSVWGAAVGAFVLVIVPQQIAVFKDNSVLVFGIFLLLAGLVVGSGATRYLPKFKRFRKPPVFETTVEEAGDFAIPGQVLTVSEISKSFGGVPALAGVSMVAQPGQITAVIGANGAGKTTLLNAISGLISVDGGTITLGTSVISGFTAPARAREGVSRTFQTPQIPEGMTVIEVVAAGRIAKHRVLPYAASVRTPGYQRDTKEDIALSLAALRLCGLEEYAGHQALELPLGQRRLLEVARSVATAPGVLLLDEPAAGLDGDGLAELEQVIQRARQAGATIILVEHNVDFVMDNADTVIAMDLGKVIAQGAPADVRVDPRVVESYLGRHRETEPDAAVSVEERAPSETPAGFPAPRLSSSEPILQVKDIRVGYGDLIAVWDVSFDARPGEITAIVGANGAGKTTLMWGVAGLLPASSGQVLFRGEDVTKASADRRSRAGLALMPEGKRVLRDMSVHENLLFGAGAAGLRGKKAAEAIDSIYSRIEILKKKRRDSAGSLSGGQQQSLAIASALLTDPKVLLVDEPSSGLSPLAVDAIMGLLVELKSEGLAIVLVEQQVEAVLSGAGAADRILVVEHGHITFEGAGGEISREQLQRRIYAS